MLFSVNVIQVACVSYLKFSEPPVAFCKGLDPKALGVLQGNCKCIRYIYIYIYMGCCQNYGSPFWIPVIIWHLIFRIPKKVHNFDNHPYVCNVYIYIYTYMQFRAIYISPKPSTST